MLTIEIDKGDILGVLLVAFPAFAGVVFLMGVIVSVMMSGIPPTVTELIPIVIVLGAFSLTGWGLWELAHWFIAA